MKKLGRVRKVLNFEEVDRLPVLEWASWWNKTIERWEREGLPRNLDKTEIMEYFGLDVHKQFWISARGPSSPKPPAHGQSIIGELSMDNYLKIRDNFYIAETFHRETVTEWAARQKEDGTCIWVTFDGFFWHPRKFMGIENHLYAFFDEPELMHRMNSDLLDFNLKMLDEFCEICVPDFVTFAEDMSYNKGPMISRELFNEFIAPYYKKIVPRLREYDIEVIIDSDGDIHELIPWFDEVDVHGFLPLERQAGVDINRLRKDHPNLKIIGGFDKMVMHKGEEALRDEFERILPVMRQGGYIPACDHQTPPAVSIDDYKLYVRLLKEYCSM